MDALSVINKSLYRLDISDFNLIQSWLNFVDAKPRTVETYTKNIRYFFSYLKNNNIANPTRETILRYRDSLRKNHKPTTVKSYLKSVQLFFKWTAIENIYPNIAQRVKAPKLNGDFKKDFLSPGQAYELLEKIDRSTSQGLRDYAILLLMLTTGLRTVSIVSADIGDIGQKAGSDALFYLNKGSNEKTDYVKLTKPVLAAIFAYLAMRGNPAKTEPLFTSQSKRNPNARMTTRSISRIAKEHLKAAGLDSPRLTAHSLRHTAATLNIEAGGTLEETQQLLAHTNANTTLVYVHNVDRSKNNSEQRITEAILGKPS